MNWASLFWGSVGTGSEEASGGTAGKEMGFTHGEAFLLVLT